MAKSNNMIFWEQIRTDVRARSLHNVDTNHRLEDLDSLDLFQEKKAW